ncbi:MAG: methylamine utilization protein [Burkholderiales bacterium]|nr:methylamine utilization protein [Burkholderiales bacterium]MDE2274724.1 methylamine utilization protein [Burkholderiales bacterium]
MAASGAGAATVTITVQDQAGLALPGSAVFLESAEARAAARPAVGVEIGQQHKQFTQRVTVVPVGTAIRFPNNDTVRHHVYSFSPTKIFELKLYAGTPSQPVLFDKPGIAVLGCNIHDTMIAWVVVVETPYYGLSDGSGGVRLDGVPPGRYRLRSWNPALAVGAPALDQPLEVTAGGAAATVKLPVAAAAAR